MADAITDAEFGSIVIRRVPRARFVKLRLTQTGAISVSMPRRAPLFLAKQLVNESREQLRTQLDQIITSRQVFTDGDIIGKTHRLSIQYGTLFASRISGTTLNVILPHGVEVQSPEAQKHIIDASDKALRTQAKAYLTRQLTTLAAQHGFTFTKIRFGTAGTRWGSCSSKGTISLNISLMRLPFTLIDYVLIHELCHTKQMNHSPAFWSLVESILPNYRELRRELKANQPHA